MGHAGLSGPQLRATGPHADELARLNGTPAKEPIRVYAGLQTADTDEARMDVLVRELERTGAFDRKLLVIIPTTGTGWVNPVAARALESMYNGDTALVGMQYSYLPSWISFLGDQQKSDGVRPDDDRHDPRPVAAAAARPAAQAAALRREPRIDGGAGRVRLAARHRTDGFSRCCGWGRPTRARCGAAITVRRDPGTPEVEPRYDNGRTVRFPGHRRRRDRRGHRAPWDGTRVLFLQHASDPIVWWSPDLLFTRPDWLSTAGPGPDGVDALVPDRDVLAGRVPT